MSVWKIAGGSVALLGALALVVASSPEVFGQQSYTFKSGDGKEQRLVVRERGPMALAQSFVALRDGVRLGVTIRDVTADDVARLKLSGQAGVLVDEVEADSPAAKGGVQKGDVALSFDGESLRSAAQFTRLVKETAPGRTVKMAVSREGKRVDLSVTPDVTTDRDVSVWISKPDVAAELEREVTKLRRDGRAGPTWDFRVNPPDGLPKIEMAPNFFSFSATRGRLGVTVQDLTPELAEFFGVKDGALVSSVQKDTPAAKAGIKAGDVITAVDGKGVTGSSGLLDQLRERSGDVSVTVMRDKKALTLKATLDKAGPQKPKVILRGVPS